MDKFFNLLTIWLYRLTGNGADRTLLLTTIGRRTGKRRTVPLMFVHDSYSYVIVGSNGGSDKMPGWFYNLKTNPHVEVQLGKKRFRARAEIVQEEQRKRLWQAFTAASQGYENMQRKTSRIFPVIRLIQEE